MTWEKRNGLAASGAILRGDIASCAQIRSPTEIETASKSRFYIVLQNVSLLPTCNVGTVVARNRKWRRRAHTSPPQTAVFRSAALGEAPPEIVSACIGLTLSLIGLWLWLDHQ